jgi:type IV pilus assembly protein PilM
LQRERGLTADQAEAVLQGRGDREHLRTMVQERADELAVGIERAAAFITAQASGTGISRVFVTGGGAALHGMVEALGNRLGIRAETANALQRLGVRPEVMEAIPINELAPMLMLPIGLALRQA